MSDRSHRRTPERSTRTAAPRRRAVLRLLGMLAVAGTLVAGATLSPSTETTASATVPGTPGTPQAGTTVYSENFSNQSASVAAVSLLNYTGGAAAANSTYTASTQYTPAGNQCNGWIMSGTTPTAPLTDLGCLNNVATTWPSLQLLARALGVAQGQTTAQAATNQVVTSYTNALSGTIAAGTQFRTVRTVPAVAGHYYAASAYVGAINCGVAGPSERFSLIVNGAPVVLSSGLSPCDPAAPVPNAAQVARLQSAAYMVPVGATANLGLELFNASTSGAGNDVAFDLPQIVDVTPQLDKSFAPAVIDNGATSTLTLTVTNTSDLVAKSDWRITDALPANLKIAATPTVGGTCAQRTGTAYAVTAPAGGSTISVVGGDLALDEASCTITVPVTSTVNGTYVNGPANITTNLNPPANATLRVISPPAVVGECNNLWFVTNTPINTNNSGTYGYVNPDTGVWTTVGILADQSSALAISPLTQTAYYAGWEHTTAAPDGIAYRLDLSTGVSTKLNTAPHPMFLSNRLTVAPDGKLWSMTVDGHLWSTTPTATSIGSPVDLGLVTRPGGTALTGGGGDIVFDGLGNLYIMSFVNTVSEMWVISAGNMAASLPRATLVGNMGTRSFPGIATTDDGDLYGIAGGTLYRIDPATGGTTSVVPGGPSSMGDLASCATPEPELSAVKDVTPGGPVRPGSTLTYTIRVTNSGPIAATGSTLIDAIPANTTYIAGSTTVDTVAVADVAGAFPFATAREIHSVGAFSGTIAPGATVTVTFRVRVNSPFPAAVTQVANQGFVRANGIPSTPTDWPVTPTPNDPVITPVIDPALALEKTAAVVDIDQDGVTGLGDHILYSFDVTNTGTAVVAGITVVDTLLTQNAITVTCTPTSIAPTQVSHCVADAPYVITQPDVDAKKVVNTAHATGTDPAGGPVRSNDDSTETPISLFRIPLQIEKVGESSAGSWVRMDGSSFAVLTDANGSPGSALPVTIDDVETGLFQIDSIPAGTYWLSELTAPDGFSLLAAPVRFTINPDRTVSIISGGDESVTAAGQIITVRDVPAMALPATGGTGPLPFILAGSLTVLISGGLALRARRRSARSDAREPKS